MATKQSTVDFLFDQIHALGDIRTKKMFGEYALYYNDKVVALICDDQLFVKPTESGKNYIGNYIEDFPYLGAKPWLLIAGDLWEDNEWIMELLRITESELPLPRKKTPTKRKS